MVENRNQFFEIFYERSGCQPEESEHRNCIRRKPYDLIPAHIGAKDGYPLVPTLARYVPGAGGQEHEALPYLFLLLDF